MYGGRVIDSYDRRIIRTYMNEYFGDFVFDRFQPFHFFDQTNKPIQYDYFIPELRDFLSAKQRWILTSANITVRRLRCSTFNVTVDRFQIEPQLEHNFERLTSNRFQHDDEFLSKNVLFNQCFPFTIFRDLYLVYVEQLPLYNPPDVLGLHPNAEINYLTQAAHDIWSNMLNIQPERDQGEDNASRERKIYQREGQRHTRLSFSYRIRPDTDRRYPPADPFEKRPCSDPTEVSTAIRSDYHGAPARDSPVQHVDIDHVAIVERTETGTSRSDQFLVPTRRTEPMSVPRATATAVATLRTSNEEISRQLDGTLPTAQPTVRSMDTRR